MRPDATMAAVLLCSSGTTAAEADMLREVMWVAAVIPRPAAIAPEVPEGAGFRLHPGSAIPAQVLPVVRGRLAAPWVEAVLAAVRPLTVVVGLEDRIII
jgi:hypothetical protein